MVLFLWFFMVFYGFLYSITRQKVGDIVKAFGLTPKQELFCKCIVSGKSGKDSYLTAYNCNSESAAMIESTKLLKRDDITKRIKELSKPIENLSQNNTISAKQKQIDEIQERIAICKEKEDENSLIRYYDMLNKIHGIYKDTQEEQKPDNPVSKLDDNMLKRLSSAL